MNNGFATLEIDGKTVGLKFGLPSLRMLTDKAVEFPNIWNKDESFSESGWAYLIYFGYINHCMVKEEPQIIKFEAFMDYVESVVYDTELVKPLQDVVKIWAASRHVNQLSKEKEADDQKKRAGNLTK